MSQLSSVDSLCLYCVCVCMCVNVCVCVLTASPAPSGHQKLLSQRYRSGSPSDDCNKKKKEEDKYVIKNIQHRLFVCVLCFGNDNGAQ